MNLTIMLFLHDLAHPSLGHDADADGGPKSPRPADPSPEGGEGEPVGDDDDEPEDRADAPG